jgi:hypothetical protein
MEDLKKNDWVVVNDTRARDIERQKGLGKLGQVKRACRKGKWADVKINGETRRINIHDLKISNIIKIY